VEDVGLGEVAGRRLSVWAGFVVGELRVPCRRRGGGRYQEDVGRCRWERAEDGVVGDDVWVELCGSGCSGAQMVAPAECIHSLPSCVEVPVGVMMTTDGVGVDGARAGGECGGRRRSRSRRGAAFLCGGERPVAAGSAEEGYVGRRGVEVNFVVGVCARALVRKSCGCWARRMRGTRGVRLQLATMAKEARREISGAS